MTKKKAMVFLNGKLIVFSIKINYLIYLCRPDGRKYIGSWFNGK
jgi:hypothetical protein